MSIELKKIHLHAKHFHVEYADMYSADPPPLPLIQAPINDKCLNVERQAATSTFCLAKLNHGYLVINASIKLGCVPIPIPSAIGFSSLEIWKISILFFACFLF